MVVKCDYCHGTGLDPEDIELECPVCHGNKTRKVFDDDDNINKIDELNIYKNEE